MEKNFFERFYLEQTFELMICVLLAQKVSSQVRTKKRNLRKHDVLKPACNCQRPETKVTSVSEWLKDWVDLMSYSCRNVAVRYIVIINPALFRVMKEPEGNGC